MSESVLKSILRLFALVAKEDEVAPQEKAFVEQFLTDHLSEPSVTAHLKMFDDYAQQLDSGLSSEMELEIIRSICSDINREVTHKQKSVIVLELMAIVLADGSISPREDRLTKEIARGLNISSQDLNNIQHYVLGDKTDKLDNENILIIGSIPGSYRKCRYVLRKELNGFISILHLKSSALFFFKYHGNSTVYLNGVPQKAGIINSLAVGSLIRWGNDDPVYYGEVLGTFKQLGKETPISFDAKNIFYLFKNGKPGLRNVTISEASGNLIALMGASGAGKSTLLHVLNGSEAPAEGQVLINGIDIHKEPWKIEGVIGFVPQDDLLIEDLTVYQNLYFAAKLCFNHMKESEIDALVMRTLDDLGLAETRDLTVGSPLRKTISGGQRKRLNIGLELLREPSVLFVDEPTSGLSSRDSENIIDLLKELSLKGKLVFAVIHQPSSDIFKMFDKLVILDTGGYQIYYGNPVDSVSYFKKSINMVDSEHGECHECGNVNPEQIFNIIETKVIDEFGNFTSGRKVSPEQWNKIYNEKVKVKPASPATEALKSTLQIPGRLKQTYLFGKRDLLSKLSNTQYMVINLIEGPLLAFILAFITRYYNVDDHLRAGYVFSKNLNLPAYLFMSVIVALFMGLTVSAEEIIRDRKILKREAFLNLSRSSYLVSKISILFILSAVQTALFVLIGNAILEIKGMVLLHWGILFTASCFANLVGLNISSAFNSAVTIYILIPILLIPQLILSGVVVKFDKLNPVIGNTATVPFVGDLMASRWAFEAGMVTQYKDNKFEKQFYELDKTMFGSDYKKIYYLPELKTRLGFVHLNFTNNDPAVRVEVSKTLALIRSEIEREMKFIGLDANRFPRKDDFTIDRYDSALFDDAQVFLETLKEIYLGRFNNAEEQKDQIINSLTNTPEAAKQFEKFRDEYQNEAIAELLKNTAEMHRIIEKDGKLVQKIYPVYKEPDPDHMVDFNAQFYMPAKHFLNRNLDTYQFNNGVIWSMTLFLAIALYFDLLRRIIEGLGNISNRAPRRM